MRGWQKTEKNIKGEKEIKISSQNNVILKVS